MSVRFGTAHRPGAAKLSTSRVPGCRATLRDGGEHWQPCSVQPPIFLYVYPGVARDHCVDVPGFGRPPLRGDPPAVDDAIRPQSGPSKGTGSSRFRMPTGTCRRLLQTCPDGKTPSRSRHRRLASMRGSWGGRRGLNPRPLESQSRALPTELRPPWLPRRSRLARPAGLEPATLGLEGRCSIRLSYGRMAEFAVPNRSPGRRKWSG